MTELSYHAVAVTSDLGTGDMLQVSIGKRSIALYNLGGRYFATDALCTHGHALLTEGYVEGDLIECPMHGGTFDIPSGNAMGQPCVTALGTYPVKIDGTTISIGLSETAASEEIPEEST
jgi:nitrite reductase/ring-hydroxylating ferredoxin subunit